MGKYIQGDTISSRLTAKKFGNIRTVKGSNYLYLDFYYARKRVRISTIYQNTPENFELLTDTLNSIGRKIGNNTFIFEEAFPHSDPKLKAYFREFEGRNYNPLPDDVLFADFADSFMEKLNNLMKNLELLQQYNQHYQTYIRPFFKNMIFNKITGGIMKDFIRSCKLTIGSSKGKLVSKSSFTKILTVFRMIWNDACEKYNWVLREPFTEIMIKFDKIAKDESDNTLVNEIGGTTSRSVFTFNEWQAILDAMDPKYHPVMNVMVMTGMIFSEISGLRKTDITQKHIQIRYSVDKMGNLKNKLKTNYRPRNIPLTKALKENLEKAMESSTNEYVFSMGKPLFNARYFRNHVWTKALKKAEVARRVPYATRHTLVAWAEVIGVSPSRLVDLMGHANKTMIFSVYGKYRDGLIDDRRKILAYFGNDFLSIEEQRLVGLLKDEN